jgi:hypothetical protein
MYYMVIHFWGHVDVHFGKVPFPWRPIMNNKKMILSIGIWFYINNLILK